MSMGRRLRELRNRRGFSVKEVAKRVGVAESTYRDWEYGRAIKGEPYVKLAGIFDVSLGELLTGESSKVQAELDQIEALVQAIRRKL